MEYKRICPNCGKEIEYKSYSAWYSANKSESLCRSCSAKARTIHCGDLSKLLEETPEAYYWMGFLMADGSFTDGRLKLALAKKDKEHLFKFAKYINYSGSFSESETALQVSVKDLEVVQQLCKKFTIFPKKTYNPPTILSTLTRDNLICFLAGFIDGDGNIQNQNKREDFFLRIKNHSSWESVLKLFGSIITDKECVKINSSGYAELVITNTQKLQELKKTVLKYDIPLLQRKWDIINLDFVSKYTKAEELRIKVLNLLAKGMKQQDIAELCGTSPSNVSKIKKCYYEGIN